MSITRRQILQMVGVGIAATQVPMASASGIFSKSTLKPPRLKPGDTVGIINPGGAIYHPDDATVFQETLAALGLKTKLGKHLLDRYGHLAGTDAARAADVNAMFNDRGVDAIFALRGGYGCSRLLDRLDYKSITEHPKILMGYSDITSLLLALNAKTGLVTFHGPVGISTWNKFSADFVKRLLFEAQAFSMENPKDMGDNLAQTKNRILTITDGKARGKLLGGNLSVFTAMVGSDYLPKFKDNILFLEEVEEDIYRVDRMMTQLKLAGILDEISGFVFGKCTDCGPGGDYGSLTLEEVLDDHIKPLGIPAWYGSMIGHISDKFTIPLGVNAEIDADKGSITLLEAAVI
ncbi:MAG: LD-carboxypeptidase [Candidatus Marinimicrobia bacterium]|jgi:muramoyltetrapeptide carboxypeptidase|nr:LD-carboxypeptidase [Candidatus Neomarinimicrobiota bacterium]MBT3632356.1 LD-carboxypeptidase [Candidatus Neomarinimicrobiota bacterium]MBT3825804.1 LD-carboxypeptidase [Candidatus Neomarinimicrobiota bacterium]MBT4129774.1 LD-carboxypeptidase [Candidatus Neomarinimicrobiota bacterium]MBT4294185.1 LD-carboxypeptidase [Candidatus Neomarinimicrobiota bacterium]